ncbi:MAG: gfo/Idh/MocA family oxidoreductase, partial [Christensenellales bacterium]
MNKPISVAIAGCGSRGTDTYARIIKESLADSFKVVAAADIRKDRLISTQKMLDLPDNMCFDSAEDMLASGKLADAMFICTP